MNIEERIKIISKCVSKCIVVPFSSPSDIRKLILKNTNVLFDVNGIHSSIYFNFINACKSKDFNVVRALLVEDVLDPSYRDSMCLTIAVKNNDLKIVTLLLEDNRVNVTCNEYGCFTMLVNNVGYDELYQPLFEQIITSDNKECKIYCALSSMIIMCYFEDNKLPIFKHILNSIHKYDLFMKIASFKRRIIQALLQNQFKIIEEYLKVYSGLSIFKELLDMCVKENSLQAFNFLLEYTIHNKRAYDAKRDVSRLLNIATLTLRPYFVKLFLSLISTSTISINHLSFIKVPNSLYNNDNYTRSRSSKELQDDIIDTMQQYSQDGRMNFILAINTFDLTLFYLKEQMFHVFNY